MRYEVQGMNAQELERRVTPRGMRGVPKSLYDTQTYVSGTTETLTFFTQAAAAGRFVTNMDQAGQLPAPEYFIVQYICLDVLDAEPGDATNLRDVHRILFGQASAGPYALFRYNSQEWGPWELSRLGGTGGPTGFTTRTATEYANNGIPGQCGLWMGGALTLQPLKAFSMDMRWASAVTLTADRRIRAALVGTHYYQIT